MKACQTVYEGADPIVQNIATLMKHIKFQWTGSTNTILGASSTEERLQNMTNTGLQLRHSGRNEFGAWTSVLTNHLDTYANMISTIDFSLASGYYPTFRDMPLPLQRLQGDTLMPTYTTISPQTFLGVVPEQEQEQFVCNEGGADYGEAGNLDLGFVDTIPGLLNMGGLDFLALPGFGPSSDTQLSEDIQGQQF